MRSLRELQREFGSSLLGAAGAAAFQPGFEIYLGNVHGNWIKALASSYPIVRKIVGESFFDGLARDYARANPSGSGDLNLFGERFPGFVAGHAEVRDLPYLADVARMEWTAHQLHFAGDSAPFDPACLTGVAPDQYSRLALRLAANGRLMVSRWPLGRIWEVHQDRYSGDQSVDFESTFERILIYRPHWRVEVESVAPGDYRLLAEAGRGAALGDALVATAEAVPSFDAAAAFTRWVGKGVIAL